MTVPNEPKRQKLPWYSAIPLVGLLIGAPCAEVPKTEPPKQETTQQLPAPPVYDGKMEVNLDGQESIHTFKDLSELITSSSSEYETEYSNLMDAQFKIIRITEEGGTTEEKRTRLKQLRENEKTLKEKISSLDQKIVVYASSLANLTIENIGRYHVESRAWTQGSIIQKLATDLEGTTDTASHPSRPSITPVKKWYDADNSRIINNLTYPWSKTRKSAALSLVKFSQEDVWAAIDPAKKLIRKVLDETPNLSDDSSFKIRNNTLTSLHDYARDTTHHLGPLELYFDDN